MAETTIFDKSPVPVNEARGLPWLLQAKSDETLLWYVGLKITNEDGWVIQITELPIVLYFYLDALRWEPKIQTTM